MWPDMMFLGVWTVCVRPYLRAYLICYIVQGPGKKWEHYETTKNGKTVRPAMHIRKGDTVQIITGKDKGKIGQITQVISIWN